jgi:glycosyltransferase involved in cell wall biosynthesis
MDDGSTDGTAELIRAAFPPDHFPQVIYRRGDTSLGPTARRNEGAKLARSPYLFTIDDDCLLTSPRTFQQTLDAFDHPRIGAVTIPFVNVKQDSIKRFVATDPQQRQVSFMYFGGMIAFRRDAYLAAGGYRTFYFMHVEEPDLSIRLLDHGFVTRLGWADPIEHLESPVRNRKRLHALGPRNHMLYHWYNTPMPAVLARVPMAMAGAFWHTIKNGYPHLGILGLVRGIGGFVHERNRRAPVRDSVYRLGQQLRRGTMTLEEVEPMLPPLAALAAVSSSERNIH